MTSEDLDDLEASDPETEEVQGGYKKTSTPDGKYMIKKLPGR